MLLEGDCVGICARYATKWSRSCVMKKMILAFCDDIYNNYATLLSHQRLLQRLFAGDGVGICVKYATKLSRSFMLKVMILALCDAIYNNYATLLSHQRLLQRLLERDCVGVCARHATEWSRSCMMKKVTHVFFVNVVTSQPYLQCPEGSDA